MNPRVLRMLLVGGIAMQLALSCLVEAAADDAPCSQQCPDDDASGKCPPGCPACACCQHTSAFDLPAEVKVLASVPSGRSPECLAQRPVAPPLAELLRPPIQARA